MNKTTFDLALDVGVSGPSGEVRVKQGDNARVIRAVLYDGGKPYRLAPGVTVNFWERKPDGEVVYNPCETDGDAILCTLTAGTTDAPGVCECEFRVIDPAAGELLTSPRFTVFVDGSVYDDDAAEAAAGAELGVLDSLIGDAEAWAVGKREGADVPEGDPAYRNNSKHYAGLAKEERISAKYYGDRAAADAARAEAGVPRLYGTDTPVPSVILTEEQYQALVAAGTVDPGKLYLIYEAGETAPQ